MKPIEYPTAGSQEYTDLLKDYKKIYEKALKDKSGKGKNQDGLETRWKKWKKKHGCIKTLHYSVEELLTLPFDKLIKFYEDFNNVRTKKGVTQRCLLELEKIFKYTKGYDQQISKFLKDRADMLKLYTCHYCDMAYINAYEETTKGGLKSQFDVDHFFSKKICPPLALSLFNFVPSCPVCNERIKGNDLPKLSKFEDLKYLSPSSFNYDFHKKAKLKLGHKTEPDGSITHFIYFVARPPYNAYVDFFHLRDRYDYHKMEALRLEHLKKSYSKAQIDAIAKTLRRSPANVHEDIFNKKYLEQHHRCFCKFTLDILNLE